MIKLTPTAVCSHPSTSFSASSPRRRSCAVPGWACTAAPGSRRPARPDRAAATPCRGCCWTCSWSPCWTRCRSWTSGGGSCRRCWPGRRPRVSSTSGRLPLRCWCGRFGGTSGMSTRSIGSCRRVPDRDNGVCLSWLKETWRTT